MGKNPNMRTRAWGPPAWFVLIMVAMGYPANDPTKKQMKDYKRFYRSFGDVMPCSLCRESYKKFIKEVPLDKTALSSRRNLVYWVFRIKNKVNEKLKCKKLDRKGMVKKYKEYDKFRATTCGKDKLGCNTAVKGNNSPKRIQLKIVPDKKAKKK